jgi:TusA-related sulfurtransferase
MIMSTIIDARGLSCPQPVLMTLDEINKQDRGEIEVLVDTDTAKENVSRAADSKGWLVRDIQEEDKVYRLVISKD